MCTSIIEIARAEGMAKRGDEWFALTQAVVAYDHARHAPLGDVITLDFINTDLEPGARAGIELTLETARSCARPSTGQSRRRSSRKLRCAARAPYRRSGARRNVPLEGARCGCGTNALAYKTKMTDNSF